MDEHEAKFYGVLVRWIALAIISVVVGMTVYNTVTRYHVQPQMETRYTFPHDGNY